MIDGAVNGRLFRAYVEQHLAPALRPGDVVVMDDLGSHKVGGVREAIEAVGGRRLYLNDCRELLERRYQGRLQLNSSHLQPCSPAELLQRISRSLRHQHQKAGQLLAALKDADRVLQLGVPTVADHLARADLYQRLECPPGERYDLQHALLLCEDPGERLRLTARGRALCADASQGRDA